MIPDLENSSNEVLGSSLSLPAHGKGWGKGNTFSCGAFCEAKYEIRRRRKSEGGAGIHFPHTPFSSRPARAKIIKIQRPDFRQKRFGFRPIDTTKVYLREISRRERIFARPRFRRFFFHRRNFSYFALRNIPPKKMLHLP